MSTDADCHLSSMLVWQTMQSTQSRNYATCCDVNWSPPNALTHGFIPPVPKPIKIIAIIGPILPQDTDNGQFWNSHQTFPQSYNTCKIFKLKSNSKLLQLGYDYMHNCIKATDQSNALVMLSMLLNQIHSLCIGETVDCGRIGLDCAVLYVPANTV